MAGPSSSSLTEAEALAKLKPELQPIAAKYGLDMVNFAVRVSACNVALDNLANFLKHQPKALPSLQVVINSQSDFCNWLMRSCRWNWDDLTGCIQAIGKAGRLSPANNPPAPALLDSRGDPIKH